MNASFVNNVLKAVQAAYEKTRLFRETKLRAVGVATSGQNIHLQIGIVFLYLATFLEFLYYCTH